MKKVATIAAAAVLLASAGTYAVAQAPAPQAPAPQQEQARPDARRGMSQEDFNRFVDARIAAIKAGLKLTADQERLWQPVENAIRSASGERFARFEERRAARGNRQSMDFMQRLERRNTMATQTAQSSTALVTALRPLWDSLSEDQKRVAPRLMRPVVDGDGMGWRQRHGRRGGHDGHHGRMEHRRGDQDRGDRGGQQAPQQQ